MSEEDAHALTTLYFEWKAAIIEHLGEVPVGFEEVTAAYVLRRVEKELERKSREVERLRRDAQLLKQMTK